MPAFIISSVKMHSCQCPEPLQWKHSKLFNYFNITHQTEAQTLIARSLKWPKTTPISKILEICLMKLVADCIV